jgi:hypothetical protein
MLLEKLDNYISEVENHDKVWKNIIMSGIELSEIIKMSEEEREEILPLLDEEMINKIKLLKEGGLI